MVDDFDGRNFSEPDWSYYRELHHVCLWQAAALKHNIDPYEFQIPPHDEFKRELIPSAALRTLAIIQNHAAVSLPLVGAPEKDEYGVVSVFCEVELKYFALWAEYGRQWKLPPEFPRFSPTELEDVSRRHGVPGKQHQHAPAKVATTAGSAESKSSTSVTVSLPHMTTDLEAVFRVMRECWLDQSKPPRQKDVAIALDKAIGRWSVTKGKSASREADLVASLLCPDSHKRSGKRSKP